MKPLALLVLASCASTPRATVQRRVPRMVFTEVTNTWVPELHCDGGTPSYNRDGAIVLCLGPAQ